MSLLKKIIVLSTGGTIASGRDASGRAVSGALAGEALTQSLPLPDGVELEVHSVFQKPSNALLPDDLLSLRHACLTQAARADVTGIVITHGTDTLEDTAYFLQSTLPPTICPVILTGSQRVPHALGTDAYTNLSSAIQVASSAVVRGCGVLVVFNDTLFSASSVRKVSTYQLNGFAAPGQGPIGYVDGNLVRLYARPERPSWIAPGAHLPRVDLQTVALGLAPSLLLASVRDGARGIVIEGIGRGHVPPDWMPVLREVIAHGVHVVLAPGCLQGPLAPAYEFPGSFFELCQAGLIPAFDLSARKARMRLMAALSAPEVTDIAELFAPSNLNQAQSAA